MNRWVKVLITAVFTASCFALLEQTSVAADTAHLKALIVTGQCNPWHNWEVSSPILKQLLEQTGLFKVDTAISPPDDNGIENFKPDFADYNVVVLDYDGYNRRDWSEQTKTNFIDYVASGGGVVIYHSSDNSFPKWKQYNQIIGLGGWGGRNEKSGPIVYWQDGKVVFDNSPGSAGAHGPAQPFQVIIRNSNHPITRGLPEKWMHARDELYGKLRGPAKHLTILATAYSDPAKGGSGRDEPVLFTIGYGKGRVFHTTLGHVKELPSPAVECVGFITTFQRGAEWAATGKVTRKVPEDFPTATEVRTRNGPDSASPATSQSQELDESLKKVAAYKFGQSQENLNELADIIRQSYGSPQLLQIEKQLLKFLRSDATLAGKQFVCRQLSIIGTEQAVPTLAAMLTDPTTSDMARYALERIPSAAVDAALRNALDKTNGKVKVGIISSLGRRGDEAAITPLSKLLSNSDKEIAQAAAAALGKIVSPAAAAKLDTALKQASGNWRTVLADAYLTCADNFAASGHQNAAIAIYEELYVPAEPAQIRSAALAGIIATEPKEAVKLIVDVLKGNEPAMQTAAIGLVRRIPATESIQPIAAELPNLSTEAQVQLLSVLADRKDPAALPVVAAAAKAQDKEIRIAAAKAIASLGDAPTAILLAQTAATTEGAERQAAREGLYRLNNPMADKTIVEQISKADAKLKVELIRSIGQRNMRGALETLLKTVQDPDENVRVESIRALKDIAEPAQIPALVNILINAKSKAELAEAEKAVVSVSRESAGENAGTAAVLKAINSVKNVNVRCALLRVLGGIGDDKTLGALRAGLKNDNPEVQVTAIRALGGWPNDAPAADLRKVAQTSRNETNRTLALRGYIRLIGLDDSRPAKDAVKIYTQAMKLAENTNEKKLVLSALANVKGIKALDTAAQYLDNEELQQEAAAAVITIAQSTIKSNPDKTEAVLKKALEITKSDFLRQQAQKLINEIK